MKRFICWLIDHDWSKRSGYLGIPAFNAECRRCHLVNESLEDFYIRTGYSK